MVIDASRPQEMVRGLLSSWPIQASMPVRLKTEGRANANPGGDRAFIDRGELLCEN